MDENERKALLKRLTAALHDANATEEYDEVCDQAETAWAQKRYEECGQLLTQIGH
jgi:hypothetical protein